MKRRNRVLALIVSIMMIAGIMAPLVVMAEDTATVEFNAGLAEELLPAGFQITLTPDVGTPIVLDGELTKEDVPVGDYTYTIEAAGYIDDVNGTITESDLTSGSFTEDVSSSITWKKQYVQFSITPDTATVEVNGSAFTDDWLDPDTYNYEVTAADYVTEADTFTVDASITAPTQTVSVNLQKDEEDVDMTAVAVTTDLSVNNGAADRIHIIFGEPTNGAAILDNLSLATGDLGTSTGEWNTNKTVFTITLANDADIANDDSITYDPEAGTTPLRTKAGKLIKEVTTAVDGNVEGIGNITSPTQMTAVIVKGSARPTASTGDKIIVVFNAPVKAAITPADLGITASDVTGSFDSTKTIYTVSINSNDTGLTDAVELKCGSIEAKKSDDTLTGSFGKVVVPELKRGIIVDNDGTSKTSGDEIQFIFTAPTNGVAIDISKIVVNSSGVNLGNSTAAWDSNNQVLTITVGSSATVKDEMNLDLSELDIMDAYGIEKANINPIDVKGSFGTSLQPRITRAVAFTQGNNDLIRVYFNTAVQELNGNDFEFSIIGLDGIDFELGDNASATLATSKTFFTITLGSNHDAFSSGNYKIKFYNDATKIVDVETSMYELEEKEAIITGSFAQSIEPEIVSVTAVSKDGSGIAQKGDKIYVVFNVAVNKDTGSFEAVNGSLGIEYSVDYLDGEQGNILVITLGEGCSIDTNTTKLKVTGFKDLATATETIDEITTDISGSFGKEIVPEILSITAVSESGAGVAKAGDKIYVVYNTAITTNGAEAKIGGEVIGDVGSVSKDDNSSVVVITIREGKANLVHIGDILTLSGIYSATTEKAVIDLSHEIGGTFGFSVPAKVNGDAVLYANESGTYIDVSFNKPVTIDNPSNVVSIGDYGVISAELVEDVVIRLKLGSDAQISGDSTLDLSKLGIKDALTGEAVENLESISVKGSIVPFVTSAKAESVNGTGHIKIIFSARTTGTANVAALSTLLGSGAKAEWSGNDTILDITLGKDYTITPNGYLVLNDLGIKGYYGGNAVTGQCKLTGSFTSDKIEVADIIASSEDVSTDTVSSGDKLTIRFTSSTNQTMGAADVTDFLALGSAERDGGSITSIASLLGANATAEWTSPEELVVTLGTNPQLAIGDSIKVSNVAFADGTGTIDGTKSYVVDGSFDGRDITVSDIAITKTDGTSGDWRISANVKRVKNDIAPTVVCVAYNSSNQAVSLHRLSFDITSSDASVVFEMPASLSVAKARIFVFDGQFTNLSDPTKVLAEPREAEYSK